MTTPRTGTQPYVSPWIERFLPIIPRDGGRVLDLACGLGRHSVLAALYGYRVLSLDRSADFAGRALGFPEIEFHRANLEDGSYEFSDELFSGIVVTNYLHRPLFPLILGKLRPGGVLLCETFANPHGRASQPQNPHHFLMPGELLKLTAGLRVLAFEDGYDRGASLQRICAVKEAHPGDAEFLPLHPPRFF